MVDNKWFESVYPRIRIVYKSLQYNKVFREIMEWKKNSKTSDFEMDKFKEHVLKYLYSMRTETGVRFSESSKLESLYALVYQIMIEGMLDIPITNKEEKLNILNSAQCDDGYFYDFATFNYKYIQGDGWGARHFVPHAIIAYERLGAIPNKSFSYISSLYTEKNLISLLESLNWRQPWGASNVVMNYLTVMQYSRDRMGDIKAEKALECALEWLLKRIRKDCGMWFQGRMENQIQINEAIRAAYHIYPLFIYDNIELPFRERVIDKILESQNKAGGFDILLNSSACHDIDAIDPLIRFNLQTNYRTDEVKDCVARSLEWVLHNQMEDGGFVFSLGEKFNYGHRNLSSAKGESNMFATWFRTLSVVYMYNYLYNVDSGLLCLPGYEMPIRKRNK